MNIESLPLELLYDTLLYLDPKEIIILCQTNNYFSSICENDDFWIFRAYTEFGISADKFKNTTLPPRLRYLELLSSESDIDLSMAKAAMNNDLDSLNILVKPTGPDNKINLFPALVGAAKGNNIQVVKYLFDLLESQPSVYYSDTLEVPYEWLISFLDNNLVYLTRPTYYSNDISDMSYLLSLSVINNNRDMFDLFLHWLNPRHLKHALTPSLLEAARHNNIDFINYIKSLGVDEPDEILLGAAKGNNKDLILTSIDKNGGYFEPGLLGAIESKDIDLIDYFIRMGYDTYSNDVMIDSYLKALMVASYYGDFNLIKHIVELMKNSNITIPHDIVDELLSNYLDNPTTKKDFNVIKYFIDFGPTSLTESLNRILVRDPTIYKYLISRAYILGLLNENNLSSEFVKVSYDDVKGSQYYNINYLLSLGARLYPTLSRLVTNIYSQRFTIELFNKLINTFSKEELDDLLTREEIENLLNMAINNKSDLVVDFIKSYLNLT